MMDSPSSSNAFLRSLSPRPELWPGIVQCLSRADLCALCLVCKVVHALTGPILYGKVDLEWQWPPRQGQSNSSPLFSLVCTLHRRPDLRTLIKQVRLRGQRPGYINTIVLPHPGQVEDAMAFIHSTSLPSQDTFARELSTGNMDAWAAALLAQLPSVRVISVEPHFAITSLMGLVLRTGMLGEPGQGSPLPSFSRLEDVSWDTMADWKLYSQHEPPIQDALLLFYLPTIRTLSVKIASPAQFSWPTPHVPTPSMLTRLRLANIREGLLGHILAVTSNLQSLHWLWYYRKDLSRWTEFVRDVIDLDQIAKDLSHVKNTLSELVITAA
jgi:hypothetical protein